MARSFSLPSAARLIKALHTSRKGPLKAKELANRLDVPSRDYRAFKELLSEMVEEGSLYRVKGQRYAVPSKINLVVGRISLTRRGDGFVQPDEGGADLFVGSSLLESAMDGDKVVVRIERRPRGRAPEGRVIKVLERAHDSIVGTYQHGGGFAMVVPVQEKLGRDVLVPTGSENGASDGDVVVVRITQFASGHTNATGEVVRVLGRPDDPGVDVLSIVFAHGLPLEFSPEVEAAAAVAADTAADSARSDCTDLNAFTIDPADAQDHDDALSVREVGKGIWEVGIHISDVSHFVEEGGVLDLEALRRATSVYLVDRVIPMLPDALSSGACSLVPGEERFALSLFVALDEHGRVLRHRLERTVIRSRHRLAYEDAQAVIDEKESINPETDADLHALIRLSRILRERRHERGALDFDLPEARVVLGEHGEPVDIQRTQRLEAHRLVEDFMLLANELVAKDAADRRLPILFRAHEPPPPDKRRDLRSLLARVGQRVPGKGDIAPRDLQAALAAVRGTRREALVTSMILRSMSRARYDPANLGHYGLASRWYCHFTSPIRRYPDLWTHRVLVRTLVEGGEAMEGWEEQHLKEVARQCSYQERVAEKAERDSIALKKVTFMEQHLGDQFIGTVSRVTAFGMFVLLDRYFVEGLVHVNTLTDDYYVFQERNQTLVGERSHKRFALGDVLTVVVARADRERRIVDFVFPIDTPKSRP